MDDISARNAEFWNEPCGTTLARSIGIDVIDVDSLRRFDDSYFGMYPYLAGHVDELDLAGADILEIGLGYGTLGQYLASRGRSYRGVDIAEEPVGLMQLRLEAIGRSDSAEALQASALELPFPAASFDVVVSIGTLHHTGNLERSISEVHRVLRPGGRALVMVYNRDSFRLLWERAKASVRTRRGRTGPTAGDAERLRGMYDRDTEGNVAPHTDFVSPAQVRRLFRRFSALQIRRRNFDEYQVWGRRIRREWFLGTADRFFGLDLYITARK